ncbi:lipid A 3-O-deacylase, partial [Pseudoponticoccus marisrubri]
ERRAAPSDESYLRVQTGRQFGPFAEAAGLSSDEHGATWLGYGLTWPVRLGPFYAELHLMPGLYWPGDGFDLGGPMVFRSGIELGVELFGHGVGIGYDHRSHAGIFGRNPGIETVMLRLGRRVD